MSSPVGITSETGITSGSGSFSYFSSMSTSPGPPVPITTPFGPCSASPPSSAPLPFKMSSRSRILSPPRAFIVTFIVTGSSLGGIGAPIGPGPIPHSSTVDSDRPDNFFTAFRSSSLLTTVAIFSSFKCCTGLSKSPILPISC